MKKFDLENYDYYFNEEKCLEDLKRKCKTWELAYSWIVDVRGKKVERFDEGFKCGTISSGYDNDYLIKLKWCDKVKKTN